MTTYSRNQTDRISQILEAENYGNSVNFAQKFRYSIITDPEITIFLGVKIPIEIPIDFNAPVELVSFHISLALRPFWLDENFEESLRQIARKFQQLVNNVIFDKYKYKYEFDFSNRISELKSILKKYYPSHRPTTDYATQDDYLFNLSIRDNILKLQTQNLDLSTKLSQDVLDICRDFYLQPTLELPAELSRGVARKRRNKIILFSKDNPNQVLLEEPGTICYFRDYNYQNIWIRTGFESYSPYFWYSLYKEDPDFRLDYLFYDWMVYAQGLLRPVINLFEETLEFNSKKLKIFSEVAFLEDYGYNMIIPGFFMPNLVYENQQAPEIVKLSYELFSSPPCSLDELYALESYNHALLQERKGHYLEAIENLEYSIDILNKYHHTTGLIKLVAKITKLLNIRKDFSESIKFLKFATDLAKSGEIELLKIFDIHHLFIKTYGLIKDVDKIKYHTDIVLKFINEHNTDDYDAQKQLCHLYLVSAHSLSNSKVYEKANEYFRQALKRIEKYPKLQFLYYYYRSIYYSSISDHRRYQKALQKATSSKLGPTILKVNAFVNLAFFMLNDKKDAKKALNLLEEAEKLIDDTDHESLNSLLDILRLKKDSYLAQTNTPKVQEVVEEMQKIQERLQHL